MKNLFALILLLALYPTHSLLAQLEPTIHYLSLPSTTHWKTLSPNGEYVLACTDLDKQYDKVIGYQVSDGQPCYESKASRTSMASFTTCAKISHEFGKITLYDIKTGKVMLTIGGSLTPTSSTRHGVQQGLFQQGQFAQPLWHNDSILIVNLETRIQGVSLVDGSTLWQNSKRDKTEAYISSQINDELVALQNDGLHLLNIKTGHKERFPINEKLSADILLKHDKYYLATNKGVHCIDKNLSPVWSTPLKKSRMAISHFYTTGDTLILINTGMKSTQRWDTQGQPFVCLFRMSDGQLLQDISLSEKKETFNHLWFYQDYVYVGSPLHMIRVNIKDGTKELMNWNSAQTSKIQKLSWGEFFRLDSTTNRFDSLGQAFDCVITQNREAYKLSATQQPELLASNLELYQATAVVGEDYLCMQGGKDMKDCWIVNEKIEPLYHFPTGCIVDKICGRSILFHTTEGKVGVAVF